MEIDDLESRLDDLESRLDDYDECIERLDDLESRLDDYAEIYHVEDIESRLEYLEGLNTIFFDALGKIFATTDFSYFIPKQVVDDKNIGINSETVDDKNGN